MQYSKLYNPTKKELPKDAEIISHKLMLKAGYIKKLSSGLYTWLPLGLRVLQKVSNIIREEMERIGFSEIQMPNIQPSTLWKETNRWDKYGPLLLKLSDRHSKEYCFAPTHEEVVTDLIRGDLSTYKNLPIEIFQINTKFRDEIRPRYGVMRAREFTMKDGYSFNPDQASLQKTYDNIMQAYLKMFARMDLDIRVVMADNGSIGGSSSHEFHVIAQSGEDDICYSDMSDFAANIELCPAINPQQETSEQLHNIFQFTHNGDITKNTPQDVQINNLTSSYFVKGNNHSIVHLILNRKHDLNEVKAIKHPEIANPIVLLKAEKVLAQYKDAVDPFIDNYSFPIIIDESAALLQNVTHKISGSETYYGNVNWQKNLKNYDTLDLRNVIAGDPSPDGNGTLKISKGIEVGHIFQLQKSYTEPMQVTFTDQSGQQQIPFMGCYGIGASRIVAAAIEQSHDEKGIIWPNSIAPYNIIIIPIDYHKRDEIRQISNKLYNTLNVNYDVLIDDRDLNPGKKFNDADLIGIPHRVVISPKLLEKNQLEYKDRTSDSQELIEIDDIEKFLLEKAFI